MPERPRGVVVCTHAARARRPGERETTMERRNFLIGMGSTAAGASALIGSGAFSRVESQRNVTIQVADDTEAYLGMKPLDTPNSQNYVALDENGHLYVQIDGQGNQQEVDDLDGPEGQGVNSDSFTYFDGMFELCNQGKADATISYELPDPSHTSLGDSWEAPDEDYDDQVVAFYYYDDSDEQVIVNEGEEVELDLGECEEIGIRTVTKGVDATEGEPLIDGEIVVTADAPEAGQE